MHTNVTVIKTKEKISFLRECQKRNLVPQHLRKLCNIISFYNSNSIRAYNKLIFRSIKFLMKIEKSDLYKYLRVLQHNLLVYTRLLYSWIPSSILNNFFRKQWLFFRSFISKEKSRLNNKLQWLSRRSEVLSPRLPPINYHCSIPPPPPLIITNRD